jgi:hypothetical protein
MLRCVWIYLAALKDNFINSRTYLSAEKTDHDIKSRQQRSVELTVTASTFQEKGSTKIGILTEEGTQIKSSGPGTLITRPRWLSIVVLSGKSMLASSVHGFSCTVLIVLEAQKREHT